MPQASRASGRQTDAKDNKAQEQEYKRATGAISCAECRRLKLKCDKTIPCTSCTRRGCASICPNGSLTTGQGTRFILADTDRLHRKIAEMSDRIRQLEDALSLLQSSLTREPHPLLRRDLLEIKSGLELHSARNKKPGEDETDETPEEETKYIDAFGTLAVRDDGASTFYGRSAGSESLLLEEKQEPSSPGLPNVNLASLPDTIARFTHSFPAAPSSFPAEDVQEMIEECLPPWPRAAQLCDLYLEQAPWFFGAITRRQLIEELLPLFYPEDTAATASNLPSTTAEGASSSSLTSSTSAFNLPNSSQKTTAHDLALIFVVFCFGALTDPGLPPAPYNVEAERYYQLTRAALNVEPVLDRPPSVVTVQTLSLMAIYQGLVADENSIESTWALMGLSARLAQSIGLHRDSARFKLTPNEVQKRRALFWELFITDCWQGLATGRLPTFSLPYVDAELPSDPDETIAEDGTIQPSFPAWKARFGKECVSQVVAGTLTARAPKYSVILELDRKIRDMELPKYAQDTKPEGAGLGQTMSHFMPLNYRELTLLYVHRGFFAQALSDHPTDPLRSPFAPSFLAGYRSACTLLQTLREQFSLFPIQIARFWVLWTHAFSSAVMLASVVTHGATTKTAQAALSELRLAYDLFERAAKYGGRAVKFLPIVRRLHDKAYATFAKGFQRKDIFTPREPGGEEHDELSIFSGRTRTVATKTSSKSITRVRSSANMRKISPGSSSASSAASPPSVESGSTRTSESPTVPAENPSLYVTTLESYGNSVHPMLVDQMKSFEGQLDAQISSAEGYYVTPVEAISPSSASIPGSGSGSVPMQRSGSYHLSPPDPYDYQQTPYDSSREQAWSSQNANASAPLSTPQYQDMHQHMQPMHPPGPVPSQSHPHAMLLPPDQQQHSVPMYGAYESSPHLGGSPQDPASFQGYGVPVPVEDTSYHQSIPPSHAPHPHPHIQTQNWSAPAMEQAMSYNSNMSYDSPIDPDPGPSHHHSSHYHPYPAHTHPSQALPEHHYPQQHHQLQRQPSQHQMMPPQSNMLAVHEGGISLTETWTSFMQQTLPVPGHEQQQQQQSNYMRR